MVLHSQTKSNLTSVSYTNLNNEREEWSSFFLLRFCFGWTHEVGEVFCGWNGSIENEVWKKKTTIECSYVFIIIYVLYKVRIVEFENKNLFADRRDIIKIENNLISWDHISICDIIIYHCSLFLFVSY